MRNFSWDDLQYFLAVARSGQLSNAARMLRTSHATVSRHIDRLELALSSKLFERNPRGYVLTAVGEKLLSTVEDMEREANKLHNAVSDGAAALSGAVRLSMLEGFGNFFLADRLPFFAQTHPNLSIDVVTIQQIMSLSRREADISVLLHMPKAGRYRCEKITDYRLFVYAAQSYLARHAPITMRAEMLAHPFIGYIEDMIFTPGLDYLGEISSGLRASYQSSSIYAQMKATQTGYGLCVLPYYMACRHADLIPILPMDIHLTREYWLVTHQDLVNAPRIRLVSDFLRTETIKARDLFLGAGLLP
ncbi:LysR family transcriptional regulator [Thalassospira sp.]|uniref:LysR family transcriptional regulator n=1 Tax=Thalassospira sp. TaxID=1912094 RepID=UPI002733D7AD|nr:LysR family transcriptional regulator [Thalassospira sp.]MDP2696983.1 LysR family transcriptional regulator [Thalassospira sp.]